MPTPRAGLSVGVVNGVLYAVGGGSSGIDVFGALGVVEVYDPVANAWTTKASMPTPRANLGVGVMNSILYAVGAVGSGNFPAVPVEAANEAYQP